MARQTQSTELDSIVELLADHGFDGLAQAIELRLNEAMKLQRSEALGALVLAVFVHGGHRHTDFAARCRLPLGIPRLGLPGLPNAFRFS